MPSLEHSTRSWISSKTTLRNGLTPSGKKCSGEFVDPQAYTAGKNMQAPTNQAINRQLANTQGGGGSV